MLPRPGTRNRLRRRSPPLAEAALVPAVAAEVLAAEGSACHVIRSCAPSSCLRRHAAAVVAKARGHAGESRLRRVLAYFGFRWRRNTPPSVRPAALALAEICLSGRRCLPAWRSGSAPAPHPTRTASAGQAPGNRTAAGSCRGGLYRRRHASLAGDLFAYRDLDGSLSASVRCRRAVLGAARAGSRPSAHAAAVTPLVGREEELHAACAWRRRVRRGRAGNGCRRAGDQQVAPARGTEERSRTSRMPACGFQPLHRESTLHQSWRAGGRRLIARGIRRGRARWRVVRRSDCRRDVALIAGNAVGASRRSLPPAKPPGSGARADVGALLHQLERRRSHPLLMLFRNGRADQLNLLPGRC